MIAVFCAFGAELAPLRAQLTDQTKLEAGELRGYRGKLGRVDVSLIVSGVGIRRARNAAAIALDQLKDVSGVILTGVAGGLHDDLAIGDVVVGDRLLLRREDMFVIEHEVVVARDHLDATASALQTKGIKHQRGPILTSRRAIAKAAEKRRAHAALGAIAVDMETAVIAHEAAQRHLPFIAIRAIMDTAAQDLDGALLADEEGRVRASRAARALVRNPALIPASFRLMRNLRIATHSMTRAVEAALATDA